MLPDTSNYPSTLCLQFIVCAGNTTFPFNWQMPKRWSRFWVRTLHQEPYGKPDGGLQSEISTITSPASPFSELWQLQSHVSMITAEEGNELQSGDIFNHCTTSYGETYPSMLASNSESRWQYGVKKQVKKSEDQPNITQTHTYTRKHSHIWLTLQVSLAANCHSYG